MTANWGANLFALVLEAWNQSHITNKATELSNLVQLSFKMQQAVSFVFKKPQKLSKNDAGKKVPVLSIYGIIPVLFLVLMPLKLKKKKQKNKQQLKQTPNKITHNKTKHAESHLERSREITFSLITFTSVEMLILRIRRRNILFWLSKIR